MLSIKLPKTLTLVDGTEVRLAPLALNSRFFEFFALSNEPEASPVDVFQKFLGCLEDSIKNGNPEMTAEQVADAGQLLPFEFVMALLDEQGV